MTSWRSWAFDFMVIDDKNQRKNQRQMKDLDLCFESEYWAWPYEPVWFLREGRAHQDPAVSTQTGIY